MDVAAAATVIRFRWSLASLYPLWLIGTFGLAFLEFHYRACKLWQSPQCVATFKPDHLNMTEYMIYTQLELLWTNIHIDGSTYILLHFAPPIRKNDRHCCDGLYSHFHLCT